MNRTTTLLADWLWVEHHLGPLGPEERRMLLGLLQIDELLERRGEPPRAEVRPPGPSKEPSRAPERTEQRPRPVMPLPLPPAGVPEPFSLSAPVRVEPPARQPGTAPTIAPRRRAGRQPVPEPLIARRTERAILARVGAVKEPLGEIDVRRAAFALSRLEILRALPRSPVATGMHGIQVLLDVSRSMIPFTSDCVRLVEALKRVVQVHQVLEIRGSPLRGAWPSGKPWRPWRPPPAKTVVIVASDLGTVAPPFETPSSTMGEWVQFAELARRARTPVVVLVPQEPRRWPAGLERLIALVPWDRSVTVSAVSRALRKARHFR